MIIENNQFNIKPGPFEHYKNGKIYILKTVANYHQVNGVWVEKLIPTVIYEELDKVFEDFTKENGEIIRKMVHRGFERPLPEFREKFKEL